ncbi:GNAT family N-acetyltransferase [Levilactobacillus tongjiangensis]|uniref:GNAT family N-acetyltransferase n=1 Tax=Levilactobacillus tongjiangensis TaxID=2486023 RepID=A0ABW1SPW3_9LACO|nr:GNAT family N-acetyltransferase [Levilactobacillus tongjiangensis]
MIKWLTYGLEDMSAMDLYKVAYERIETFVVAQKRIYQEIDDVDPVARHILGYQDGELVAYARVFMDGDHVTFGRVLTAPEHRGEGLGRQLMAQIEAEIKRSFPGEPISIEAQVDKQHFYEKFGYQVEGDMFLFNSTPHLQMIKAALV